MKITPFAVSVVALSLVLYGTEGKSMLEKIAKRSVSLVTFNGRRVLPANTRFENVPNYGMPDIAATVVANANATQPQSLTPAVQGDPPQRTQTVPQRVVQAVVPATYGSRAVDVSHRVPGYAPGYVPDYDPGYVPVQALPQVSQHSHTPTGVQQHTHTPAQNPNPGIIVIQVPSPQNVNVPVNVSAGGPAAGPGPNYPDLETIIALIRTMLTNTQTPAPTPAQTGGGGSSEQVGGGGSSD